MLFRSRYDIRTQAEMEELISAARRSPFNRLTAQFDPNMDRTVMAELIRQLAPFSNVDVVVVELAPDDANLFWTVSGCLIAAAGASMIVFGNNTRRLGEFADVTTRAVRSTREIVNLCVEMFNVVADFKKHASTRASSTADTG